ncbi:unnamed protein product, partial [Nesidiocoris tenuis]
IIVMCEVNDDEDDDESTPLVSNTQSPQSPAGSTPVSVTSAPVVAPIIITTTSSTESLKNINFKQLSFDDPETTV